MYSQCGRFLGLSEQETVQFVPSLGWTVEGPLITPAHPTKRKHQQASLTQLDQLTTYIADLEQQQ